MASDKEQVGYFVGSQVVDDALLVPMSEALVDHTDVEVSQVSFFLSGHFLVDHVLFNTFVKTSFLLND